MNGLETGISGDKAAVRGTVKAKLEASGTGKEPIGVLTDNATTLGTLVVEAISGLKQEEVVI